MKTQISTRECNALMLRRLSGRVLVRLAGFGAVLLCLVLHAAPGWSDPITPPPPGVFSTLIPGDGSVAISSLVFADLISKYLIKNGSSNVLDAKFFFQECFGGAMLSEVGDSLSGKVPWVGGSASAFDQESWGSKGDAWTNALIGQLNNQHQTISQALVQTSNRDTDGPKGAKLETPQSGSSKDGSKIALVDPKAKSYHAVLWGGAAEDRHIQDLSKMYNVLKHAWGDPGTHSNVTISELVGKNANLANLTKVLSNLPLNPNEEFLFYASDHGGTNIMLTPRSHVHGGNSDVETLTLDSTQLAAIKNGESTTPTLTIDYSGVITPSIDPVYFDGSLLGYLQTGQQEDTFNLSVGLLSLSNTITIDNHESSDIYIDSKTFDSGSIDTGTTTAPEPSTLLLLCSGVVSIACVTRKRPLGRASARSHRPSEQYSISIEKQLSDDAALKLVQICHRCRCELEAVAIRTLNANVTGRLVRLMIAAVAIVFVIVPVVTYATATTSAPTAGPLWGHDDFNTSTLKPYGARYADSTKFLDKAKKGTPFENWDFSYVDQAKRIPMGDLKPSYYQAWVVTNDPFRDPNRGLHQYPYINKDDAGGADFVLIYSPHGSGEPKASEVMFLQIVKETINNGAPTYRIDNAGDTQSPYYDTHFSVGYTDDGKKKWMTDIPFVCENGAFKADWGLMCKLDDKDELITSYQAIFETYVVEPSPTGVDIYGGREWGFSYSAFDTPDPEPGTLLLLGSGILGASGFLRKRLLTRS